MLVGGDLLGDAVHCCLQPAIGPGPARIGACGRRPAVPREEARRADPDDQRIGRKELVAVEADRGQLVAVLPQVGWGQHRRRRLVEDLRDAFEQADVEVLVRLAEREHHPRVHPQVRDLPGVGLARDQDGLAVPAEPDRDEVRQAVRAHRAEPHDGLGLEQA